MGNICCKSRKKFILDDKEAKLDICTKRDITIPSKNLVIQNILDEEKSCFKINSADQEKKDSKVEQESEYLSKLKNLKEDSEKIISTDLNQLANEEVIKIVVILDDEENSMIEDTFFITIKTEHKDKNYLLLEEYLNELYKANLSLLFKYNDLDNILLHLINNETKVIII